uniref:SSCRP protein n=1 Tax=Panagrellus redivivus TaxID=6233 RepID=A0A7E4ZY85_PANRE
MAFVKMLAVLAFLGAAILMTNAADTCHAGLNARYAPKQCAESGSICQKYVCEGGQSPFTLRACGLPNSECDSFHRMCEQSAGNGTCFTCAGNNCNSAGTVGISGITFGCLFISKVVGLF